MTNREKLHRLVDELSEAEVTPPLRLVETQRHHPLLQAVANAPEDDEPSAHEFMPRIWVPTTSLIQSEPESGRGEMIKTHNVTVQWGERPRFPPGAPATARDGLSYYRGDDNGQRGFEIELLPASTDAIWSDDWEGDEGDATWNSNLPSAYRDDLAFDGDPKPFAVGTPNGRELEPFVDYWASFDTNEGFTDSGNVHVQGQATSQASVTNPGGFVGEPVPDGFLNAGYCVTAGYLEGFPLPPVDFEDSHCTFGVATEDVDPDYAIPNSSGETRVLWGQCPFPWDELPDEQGRCTLAQ